LLNSFSLWPLDPKSGADTSNIPTVCRSRPSKLIHLDVSKNCNLEYLVEDNNASFGYFRWPVACRQ